MPDKVKNILILIKTDRGIFECNLTELTKKEILKKLDEVGILLVGNDLSENINF